MSTKPEVSDEELREYMNFEELLDRRKAAVRKMRTLDFIRKGGILSAAVITLSIVWFIYRGGTGEEQVMREAEERVVSPGAAEPDAPNTGHDNAESATRQDVPLPVTSDVDDRTSSSAQPDVKPNKAPVENADDKGNDHNVNDNDAAEYQYTQAEPVEGFPALYEYFNSKLVYPPEAVGDSIQGVVTGSFIIGVSGAPEDIRIENSLGKVFDDEVKRLIENMPAWKPATVNGRPVPSRLSIPVTFQLQRVKN